MQHIFVYRNHRRNQSSEKQTVKRFFLLKADIKRLICWMDRFEKVKYRRKGSQSSQKNPTPSVNPVLKVKF